MYIYIKLSIKADKQCESYASLLYNIIYILQDIKNLNLRKEVGIITKVQKQVVSSNQLKMSIMHQPVIVSSNM